MAKVKVATLFMIVLLVLFSTLTYAARPEPASINSSPAGGADGVDECQGLGEDECLARRTLAAHLDYIYTQNHKDHP